MRILICCPLREICWTVYSDLAGARKDRAIIPSEFVTSDTDMAIIEPEIKRAR